jgi:ABC-type transport system substrate-binding protein
MHTRRGHRARHFSTIAAVWGLALGLLAACGTDTGSSGGMLRYGYDFDAQFTNTFDVSKSNGDCDQVITQFIYDSLLRKDAAKKLHPALATEWNLPPGGKEIDLTLRPGMKFSDGSPVDAEAVGQALLQNGKNPQLTSVALIKTYKVVDPTHIKLILSDEQAIQVLYALAGPGRDGMIMSPASFADADQHPVGAGPFMLKSYTKGAEVVLEKNPNYWDKSVYKDIDGIDYVKVATGPPSVTALKAGNVDMIRLESDSVASLRKDNSVGIAVQPSGAYLQFEFRIKNADGSPTPFAKLQVRQAFEQAINREEINKVVQNGEGELTVQPFPKGDAVHVDSLDGMYKYDPDKAKQLLAQAGYPNGFDFDMVIPGGGIHNMESQAVLIQNQLKQIGVNAHIVRILPSDIATGYYIGHKGDAFAAEELGSSFPGGSLYSNYGVGQYVATYNGSEHQDITSLMRKAQSTTDINETIRNARAAAEIAVKEALDVPIAFAPQFNAYNKNRVSGEVHAQTDICDPPDFTKIKVSG